MVSKKVWSKFAPGMTAQVISEPDYRGLVMAWVTDTVQSPDGPIVAVIAPAEWSEQEIVPVPDSVPDQLYVAYYGDDPSKVQYKVFDNELSAAFFSSKRTDAFGYGPVTVQRLSMTLPFSDHDED